MTFVVHFESRYGHEKFHEKPFSLDYLGDHFAWGHIKTQEGKVAKKKWRERKALCLYNSQKSDCFAGYINVISNLDLSPCL